MQQDLNYFEFKNEIPINTIRTWYALLMKNLAWEFVGWSGEPKEPLRHWAAYPPLEDELVKIWEVLADSIKLEGLNLVPDRIIANLYSHGDNSWLHKDCDEANAWTVILYLNDYWNNNWHGGTVLFDGDSAVKYFNPEPGKFILFKSNMLHGAIPVSREAVVPRFGLTFQCHDNNLSGFSKTALSSIRTTQ